MTVVAALGSDGAAGVVGSRTSGIGMTEVLASAGGNGRSRGKRDRRDHNQ